jgi:PTH1 family peptidyl-tRNA hydrolase
MWHTVCELDVQLKNLLVIQDDLERSFGKWSIKKSGSANGHNGIRSIINALSTMVRSL